MSTGRRAITAAAAAAALLLSAACTGDKKASSRKGSQQVALRIGIVYTTGGQGADLAGPVLGAAKLATDDALKDGVKITVSEADYGGDPAKVAAAVQALATKVDAVVVGSDDTDIVPYLGGPAVPLLHSFITGDAAVPDQGSVFRLAPSNRLQASRIAAFLTGHRKYTRIALITDDTAFGKEGRRDLSAALSRAGVNPIAQSEFTPGKDVHAAVSAAGQKGAQAVVVWVESPGEASRIVVDAHKQNLAYQIVLSGNLATAAFAKNASSQVAPVAFRDGMLSVGTWAGPWFQE